MLLPPPSVPTAADDPNEFSTGSRCLDCLLAATVALRFRTSTTTSSAHQQRFAQKNQETNTPKNHQR